MSEPTKSAESAEEMAHSLFVSLFRTTTHYTEKNCEEIIIIALRSYAREFAAQERVRGMMEAAEIAILHRSHAYDECPCVEVIHNELLARAKELRSENDNGK